jgi:AraC-like DNA-binding protein
MKNEIYLFDFYAVIISDSLNTEMHSHLAHQITFSVNDEQFQVEIDGEIIEDNVLFIPSGKPHRFLESNSKYLSILMDNESLFEIGELKRKIEKLDAFPRDLKDVKSFIKSLGVNNHKNIDSRVVKIKEMIDHTECLEKIRLNEISKEISLSESRTLHLFKEQVGVPFRKYILWKKLKRAISLFANTKDKKVTDIALEAGFSDSAHLSKIIKSSFGLSPTEILKNSQFIKDH